ncbi:cation:proton antiporter [Paenibacillus sp. Soil787]|uniref:cation:proton antiporter n=1 Tax=Paenibacillus sp. Soil787 TaxID=1736411 RepID=UPI0006F6143C|nr:cation:proton antiporter [Paenibacillus sp. Soil787]KRF42995.1 sodium:proton antiporter [Paenibacillus sp. Soil787]
MTLYLELLIILLFTKLASDLSVRLGQPAVLGKLLIGIILGPAVLGWVESGELIDELSEIGVLMLMFIAGLETDLQELRRNLASSFAVALGGVIFPFAGGYLTGISIGFSTSQAMFLGLLLSATSVSISVQVLKDLNRLNSREGTTMLGAAVIDDVLVVVLLAVLLSMVGGADVSLPAVLFKKALFFGGIILLGWKAVPWSMTMLAPLRATEAVISAALIICFLFAYLAEYLGVAGMIGAFAAGIAISHTKYKHTVEERLEPIAYAIFVPVFFVSIGLSVTFEGVGSQLWLIVGLTVVSVITKMVGGGLGAKLTGFSWTSAFGIGSGMISRGEVALIIAAIGLNSGLLNPSYFTPLLIVVILTTLITPPLLKLAFGGSKPREG